MHVVFQIIVLSNVGSGVNAVSRVGKEFKPDSRKMENVFLQYHAKTTLVPVVLTTLVATSVA
ncbi:hypothetical protein DPMN_082126 [Dreissena polymorpha]|uniref:EAL domain-containing protein n=1 Tax=Dreissena polymorpha TaxID=45954 RepID=A0A9D3Y740_DREPO|nr:hypothetical protein DPMN_082126 [Dreissena polymorpha]